MNRVTPFQEKVYGALAGVPRGRVISYRGLARRLGCPGGARAVGRALRENPLAPHLPCHRVIGSDGRIGGFRGAVAGPEIARKRELLAAEGVKFDENGRLREPSRML